MSLRVLVVDDDTDIRETFVEVLEDAGHGCVSACNGLKSLERLRADVDLPDVILLDLRMPLMDGEFFRDAQLEDARLASVPAVIVLANAQVGDAARRLKAAGHFKKHVDLRELLEIVDRFAR